MLNDVLRSENIVHIGALLYLAGFLFRNQLILRGLIIAGDFVYILYFYFAPEVPLWGGIFWSCMFTIVNVVMIGVIIADRIHFSLTDAERRLFELLQDLTPGQFRQLLRTGRAVVAQTPTTVTTQDAPVEHLYFVVEGAIDIEKNGHQAVFGAETFIGEIAFLLSRPATATVTLGAGCMYFAWPAADLRALLVARPDIGTAVTAAINRKLAEKVATAGLTADVVAKRVE